MILWQEAKSLSANEFGELMQKYYLIIPCQISIKKYISMLSLNQQF